MSARPEARGRWTRFMDRGEQARQARAFVQTGNYPAAFALFRELCGQTHAPEDDYGVWLEGLGLSLEGLAVTHPQGSPVFAEPRRALAYFHLLLKDHASALRILDQEERVASTLLEDQMTQALDRCQMARAQCLAQMGRLIEAGELYRNLGRFLQGAIAFERGGANSQARACWEQGLERLPERAGTYERALVHFNLGHLCLSLDEEVGQSHLVMAQRLLEEAADELETAGKRERAFDCYQILMQLGRRSGAFENMAEGYVNCIRILSQDGLKYYVIQYYEDFVEEAIKREEFHAAATLYEEAASFCLRAGLLYHPYYMLKSAESWVQAAQKAQADATAPELAENAYLAAVDAFNVIEDYQAVGQMYARLSQLKLPARKQQRYRRIAARYVQAPRSSLAALALPASLRQTHAYPDIWYQDLIELDLGGDAEATCASVVGDAAGFPSVVRRRAFVVLLDLLEQGFAIEERPAALAQVAEGLGELQIYAALHPLERLLDHPSPRVHRGVMRSLRFLFFKRSFGPLERGLLSEDAEVRREARDTLARLHFRHAFDPLVRIFREHRDLDVRRTALRTIGQIASLEAGDFLIEVLRQEGEPLRSLAHQALMQFPNREILPVLRQHYELESGPLRTELADIISRLGRT